jgi:hypothetical protein
MDGETRPFSLSKVIILPINKDSEHYLWSQMIVARQGLVDKDRGLF